MEEFLDQLLQATQQEASIYLEEYKKNKYLIDLIVAENIYSTVYQILDRMRCLNNKNCKYIKKAQKVLKRKINQLQ